MVNFCSQNFVGREAPRKWSGRGPIQTNCSTGSTAHSLRGLAVAVGLAPTGLRGLAHSVQSEGWHTFGRCCGHVQAAVLHCRSQSVQGPSYPTAGPLLYQLATIMLTLKCQMYTRFSPMTDVLVSYKTKRQCTTSLVALLSLYLHLV